MSAETTQEVASQPLEPPARTVSRAAWVRANLASSPLNALLTLVFGAVLAWATYRLARFVFVTADWEIVRRNLRLFMVGRFPADQLWRPWAAAYVLAAVLGLTLGVAAASAARVADPADPLRRRPSAVSAAERGGSGPCCCSSRSSCR